MTVLVPELAADPRPMAPTTLVLHATATSTPEEAVAILRRRWLSYHFIVARDGDVWQLVHPLRAARHCGRSVGPNGYSVNRYSVGVALVDRNDGLASFPCAQVAAWARLAAALVRRYPTLRWVTTHAAIAPGRKNDPVGFALEPVGGLAVWPATGGPPEVRAQA